MTKNLELKLKNGHFKIQWKIILLKIWFNNFGQKNLFEL